MHRWLAGLASWMALLSGCDERRVARLEAGVSTEAQVRAEFGAPHTVHDEADGGRTLEYSRQPEGRVTYMITIGPEGLVRSLEQVLAPAHFERLTPGMSREAVRRALGRPAQVWAFPLKREIVWDWRWRDGTQDMVFSVTFDEEGRLLHTARSIDPRLTEGG